MIKNNKIYLLLRNSFTLEINSIKIGLVNISSQKLDIKILIKKKIGNIFFIKELKKKIKLYVKRNHSEIIGVRILFFINSKIQFKDFVYILEYVLYNLKDIKLKKN